MPKAIGVKEARPRRRGRKKAAPSAQRERKRGPVMRLLLRSPKDSAAGAVALAAVLAVIVNAMFLQSGRHPAPMFPDQAVVIQPAVRAPQVVHAPSVAPASAQPPVEAAPAPASPLPRPRPAGADRRTDTDPIGQLVRTVAAREEAPSAEAAPVPSRRVVAVQRVLSEYGYGQLAPTGRVGAETRAAIRKFELARQLPVTGEVSEQLIRELAAMTGRRID